MSRLTATFYNRLMFNIEQRCLRAWRTSLLAEIKGDALEIGAGTGLTLPCYPEAVSHLTLSEPDRHMRDQLLRVANRHPLPTTVLDSPGESLPLPSGSFDAVILCLVLCSVSDPLKVLSEASRLLKPEGQLYFIEHVSAPIGSSRQRWQQRIEPLWKRVAGNCHLTRQTEQTIIASGFSFEQIHRQEMRPAPPFVRPTIRGIARKLTVVQTG